MRYVTTYNDKRIKKVVTISSPLKGTFVASLLPQTSILAKNFGYNCEIVQQINADRKNVKLNHKVQIYHIVASWDQLIIPSHCAKYDDTPDDNIYHYKGCIYSHGGITHSICVAQSIVKWLQ